MIHDVWAATAAPWRSPYRSPAAVLSPLPIGCSAAGTGAVTVLKWVFSGFPVVTVAENRTGGIWDVRPSRLAGRPVAGYGKSCEKHGGRVRGVRIRIYARTHRSGGIGATARTAVSRHNAVHCVGVRTCIGYARAPFFFPRPFRRLGANRRHRAENADKPRAADGILASVARRPVRIVPPVCVRNAVYFFLFTTRRACVSVVKIIITILMMYNTY